MSINFESHKLDRRSFLKGAGVIGAAGLLSACGGSSSNNGTANSAASGTAAPNTTGGAPLSEYISFESANRELESWNMLYTQLGAQRGLHRLDVPPARRCRLGRCQRRGEDPPDQQGLPGGL